MDGLSRCVSVRKKQSRGRVSGRQGPIRALRADGRKSCRISADGVFGRDTIFAEKQTGYLKALKAKAAESGEPLRFVATFWTPPSAMKDNQSTKKGHLLPAGYADLGRHAVSAIQAYKDIGIDLYALSLQNEPMFEQTFNSCAYTVETYRDMLKVAGPIIKARFPDTKLFGAEHMLWALEWDTTSYEAFIIADPAASPFMDIWACHGYEQDGQTPDPKSKEAHQWQAARQRLEPTGKPFWMTETSGFPETWPGAMALSQAIYAAVKYGNASAWLWWQISEPGLGKYVLMDLGKPGMRYHVSKNYYRYIRPGAVHVETTSDDPQVLAIAFTHAENKTLAVVLINTSDTIKNVDIKIDNAAMPKGFSIYRTSKTENCVLAGQTLAAPALALPAGSVTTLFGATTQHSP